MTSILSVVHALGRNSREKTTNGQQCVCLSIKKLPIFTTVPTIRGRKFAALPKSNCAEMFVISKKIQLMLSISTYFNITSNEPCQHLNHFRSLSSLLIIIMYILHNNISTSYHFKSRLCDNTPLAFFWQFGKFLNKLFINLQDFTCTTRQVQHNRHCW